jgi:hypothetical protein
VPFTLSHPAAVVPLARWLPLSALAAGAMAPDLNPDPYRIATSYAHDWPGLVSYSFPLALACFVGFQTLGKWPLVALFPEPIRRRLAPVAAAGFLGRSGPAGRPRGPAGNPIPAAILGLLRVLAAVVLGLATHIAWDGCTHHWGWAGETFPVLIRPLFRLGRQPVMAVDLIFLASSVLGLALLALWARAWLARAPAGADLAHPWRERQRIAVLTLAALALMLLLAANFLHYHYISGLAGFFYALVRALHATQDASVALLAAYCSAWWLWRLACLRAPAPTGAGAAPSGRA